RTEPATPKKMREARKKGQTARSVELTQGLALAVVVVLLPKALPKLAQTMANDWKLTLAIAPHANSGVALAAFGKLLTDGLKVLAPVVGIVALVGLTGQIAMVGARPNPYVLKPKFERLNPKNGIKRLFSKQ